MNADSSSHKLKQLRNRVLAALIAIGTPLLAFKVFQYDEFLHLALKFPNWLIGIFAGPMAGVPLGIVIASLPLLLAFLSGLSWAYAWKLWNYGTFRHQLFFKSQMLREERRLRWGLALAISIPIYTVVLILRASGTYFYDGLIPFWIQRNFKADSLKVIVPYMLYFLFGASILYSWIHARKFRQRFSASSENISASGAAPPTPAPTEALEPNISSASEASPTAPNPVNATLPEGEPVKAPMASEKFPDRLYRAALIVNIALLISTFVFIKIFGRRGY